MSELVKELMPYLEKLAAKLDSSAQVLWQMQMAQAKVIAITIITEWVAVGIVIYLWVKGVKKYLEWRKIKDNSDFDIVAMMVFLLVSAALSILTFGCLAEIKTLATIAINPEYWALKEIIKMVK